MQGRISVLAVGLALALGGGVAGAALVGNQSDPAQPALPPAPPTDLTAERSPAGAQKVALAKLQHALKTAQRARRIARRARNKANESLATTTVLLDEVDKALADSAEALAAARDAEDEAAAANNRIDSTRIVSDAENGTVTTADDTAYVPLGGPEVVVEVPPSGLIEVWARVRFEADGAVALFEDGNHVPIPGQEGVCTGGGPLEDAIISAEGLAPITLSTPPAFSDLGLGCGTAGGQPGSILLQRTPGIHTYELRYGDVCDCDPAEFAERELRVGPRL